jgi:geranylgeranyl pyrophosphate synthase
LDKGALSLPIIYLAETLSPQARRKLLAPLREPSPDRAALARIAREAEVSGAIARAQARAREMADEGLEALAGTPLNGLSKAYALLADYAIARRR